MVAATLRSMKLDSCRGTQGMLVRASCRESLLGIWGPRSPSPLSSRASLWTPEQLSVFSPGQGDWEGTKS